MPRPDEVSRSEPPRLPEDFLRLAMTAKAAARRARYARAGLACEDGDLEPDTQVLLLRQLYLAHLELRQLRRAVEVARQMAEVGPLRDIAHHDVARALFALGDARGAIAAQRLAARSSPASRRSFHLFSLGSYQHFSGDVTGAIATLRRAERWAMRDRPLIRAYLAYVRLDAGKAVRELGRIIAELQRAKCREGYGQFVLGMLHQQMGDERRAAVHLRAFLTRNASADPAKVLTLREELRRARLALAAIESV